MIINIILLLILIYFVHKYLADQRKDASKVEKFDYENIPKNIKSVYDMNQTEYPKNVNDIRPYINNKELNEALANDIAMSNVHELDYPQILDQHNRERNDKFRNRFFAFRNKINNTTHLNDPVDNMGMTNNAQMFENGDTIGNIYDKLVNSYDYKTNTLPSCYEKRQIF